MSIFTKVAMNVLLNNSHPEIERKQCWNLHPHREQCTDCKDICPYGEDIFSRPNLVKDWDPCTDCGLCVSVCRARCIIPSTEQVQRDLAPATSDNDTVWIGCEKSTRHNDLVRACVGALSWEALAYLALNKKLVLDLTPCGECENDLCAQMLRNNLTRLVEFLGEPLFNARFTLAYQPEDAPYEAKELSRREMFTHMSDSSKNGTKQLLRRLPVLQDDEENRIQPFRYALSERVKQLILERVRAVSVNASIFALSALDELCRKTGKKRPNPELAEALESGFEAFYAAVDDDILLQKEVIQAQRLVGLSRSMIKDTRSRIELIGKMLGIKKSELQQMEQQCHTDMANIDLRLRKSTEGLETLSRRLCREARGWMDIFLSRMKQELTALGSSQPTSILQKHLQFYLSDHIRQAILACLGAHRPQMEKCLREYAQGFSQESLRGIGEGQLQDVSIQLADISWTSVDTAAFAINTGSELLFGTESQMHGIISGISTLVGGFWRESKMKTRQQDILQPLLEKFPDISEDVFAQLENAYAQMSKAACNRLAEMFRSQMDISLEALEQAQKVLQNEDLREEELKEQLSVTGEILDRAERLLDSTGIGADPAGREEAL